MEYITLKNSDLKVSRLCMGGCPMGGYGWGAVWEEELIGAVHCAVENGISFFDTADVYGLGQSERTLGKALGARRKEVAIATKFGVRRINGKSVYDNRPEWIREALKASLERLGTDYVDLYQLHYRDGVTPLESVVETLEELKEKGYIRYYGLSNVQKGDLEELRPWRGKFVSFQDEYSLACRKNEVDICELAKEMGMTPLTWGSLGQGVLTGKYGADAKFDASDRRSRAVYENFHGEKLRRNLEIVEALRGMVEVRGKSVAAGAIRFILDNLPGSVALVGAKRREQILSNLEAMDWNLSEVELRMLLKMSNENKNANRGGVRPARELTGVHLSSSLGASCVNGMVA